MTTFVKFCSHVGSNMSALLIATSGNVFIFCGESWKITGQLELALLRLMFQAGVPTREMELQRRAHPALGVSQQNSETTHNKQPSQLSPPTEEGKQGEKVVKHATVLEDRAGSFKILSVKL
jgi:hypothetical protein